MQVGGNIFNKHVPPKLSSTRKTQTYIFTKHAKTNNTTKDLDRYSTIKAESQRETRIVRNNFIRDNINQDLMNNPIRARSYFRSNIKNQQQYHPY